MMTTTETPTQTRTLGSTSILFRGRVHEAVCIPELLPAALQCNFCSLKRLYKQTGCEALCRTQAEILKENVIFGSEIAPVKVEDIELLNTVLRVLGVEQMVFFSKNREQKTADARTIYCHLLRKKGYTGTQIAQIIGRNEPSALHHLKKYDQLTSINDRQFIAKVNNINAELQNATNS